MIYSINDLLNQLNSSYETARQLDDMSDAYNNNTV